MTDNSSGSTSDQDQGTVIGERSIRAPLTAPPLSPTISVVVPTYREVENLPALIERLAQLQKEYKLGVELLIMDDDSQDGSKELIAKLALPWVRLVVRKTNRGLSAAVLDGLRMATGATIVVMDADLSHPPEKIPEMLAALDRGAEFVIGSRYVAGGATGEDWGVFRWLNSKVATWLARPFTRVADPMSGFFAFRRSALAQAGPLNPVGYKIGLELLVKCGFQRVVEVPIVFAQRQLGSSKLSFQEQLRYLQHLGRLLVYKFAASPKLAMGCMSALFLVSRIVVVLVLAGRMTDLEVHKNYAARIYLKQEIPYRDFVPEYPPLSLVFTTLPATIDGSLRLYDGLFRGLCFLVDCGIWALLLVRFRQGKITAARLVLYVFGTTALGALLYDRVDLVLGAMLLVAATALRDGRDDSFYLALGLGIAYKLIPVIFVPMAVALEWTRPGRRIVAALLRLALPTVISCGVIVALGGNRLSEMLDYHRDRGVQIESVPASLEMMAINLAPQRDVEFRYGCHQLTTPWSRSLATAASVFLAAIVAGSVPIALRCQREAEGQTLLFAGVLTGALVCSKVLSPQYFLFLLPVLVVLPAARSRSAASVTWGLVVTIYCLTGAEFPWMYRALVKLNPWAESLVIVRNGCLIALSIALFGRAWKHASGLPGAAPDSLMQ
jgi:glycosyltransferase involved in cell wall biosynthesis